MIGRLHNRTLAAGVVAALQLGALTWFVWDREHRVRAGTDVVLEVVPVDPRSLFQGDYVILNYPISTLQAWYGAEPKVGQTVFMTVVPGDAGNWTFAEWGYNAEFVARPGGVTLKGKIDRVIKAADGKAGVPGDYHVAYGLERFFVPEGQGLGVEQLARDKKLSAIVSVWRDGSSTLKGLISQGKVLYETGVAAKRPEDLVPLAEQVNTGIDAVDPAPPVDATVQTPAVEAPIIEPPPAPGPPPPPVRPVEEAPATPSGN